VYKKILGLMLKVKLPPRNPDVDHNNIIVIIKYI